MDKKKQCFAKRHFANLTNHMPGLLPVHLVVNICFVEHTWKLISGSQGSFDDGVAASRTMTGRLNYIWTCTMKNSKESSAVAEENIRGERQQPRRLFVDGAPQKLITRWAQRPRLRNHFGTCQLVVSIILSRQGVCTIAPLLLKPPTLNGLPNSSGYQRHVTRP